jgi:transcriptional regulator with XRE-family HTH domain
MKENKEIHDVRNVIASRLGLAREQAGLTQGQAAKLLNLPRPSISEIEAGRRRVAAEELIAFAKIYRVSLSWLAGEDAEQMNPLHDRVTLAARAVADLKPKDLQRVLKLLTSLGTGGKK